MTEKRMKILHVLTDRNIGGAGRWLLYYLKYHNREKFAVQVVLPHLESGHPGILKPESERRFPL